MNRSEFISRLREELKSLNVSDTYIEVYISHFNKQFDKMPAETLEKQLGSYENVHTIAVSIKNSIDNKIKKRNEQKASDSVSAAKSSSDVTNTDTGVTKTDSINDNDSDFDKIDSESVAYMNGSAMFRLKFFLLLPLIFCLYALVTVAVFLLDVLISVLTVTCGIVCIAAAIATIVVPALGLYYGIGFLSTSHAQGLYEIGLGIFSLGAGLGISVVFYFVTSKLMPKLLHKCNDLLTLFFRKGKNVYITSKRRSVCK